MGSCGFKFKPMYKNNNIIEMLLSLCGFSFYLSYSSSLSIFDLSIYFCWGINVFSLENYLILMEKYVSNTIIIIKTFYK